MQPKFELFTLRGGGFFWRLYGEDGDVVLVSNRAYPTRGAAERSIAAVRQLATAAPIVDTTET